MLGLSEWPSAIAPLIVEVVAWSDAWRGSLPVYIVFVVAAKPLAQLVPVLNRWRFHS